MRDDEGTKTTNNQIAMQDRKCCNCDSQCKEAQKMDRNTNTLIEKKKLKVVLQKIFEITTRSPQVGLTLA